MKVTDLEVGDRVVIPEYARWTNLLAVVESLYHESDVVGRNFIVRLTDPPDGLGPTLNIWEGSMVLEGERP